MENKLQELTNKLYEEGLAKGRSDAERLVADAQAKADAIVREAEEKAAAVVEEVRRNTMTEVTLAGRQAVGALKEHISEMIIAKTLSGPVHEAAVDPAFVREMLLAVAAGWRADSAGKVTLSALLPAEWQERFGKEFEAAAKSLLAQGVEVGYSDSVRSGFRIGEKNGGYYISFSEADFEALLSEFLKERVAKMLYAEK